MSRSEGINIKDWNIMRNVLILCPEVVYIGMGVAKSTTR